jgi:ABC-type dipeptide/oligopeptide/nickel transport system permease subunit
VRLQGRTHKGDFVTAIPTLSSSPKPSKAENNPPRTMWGDVWRKFSQNILAMMGLTIVIGLYLTALFAPLLVTQAYDDIDLDLAADGPQAPSFEHLLGTDELGRDVWSRMIWASRSAAFVSIFVPSIGLTLGILFGTFAGYFGGWTDTLIMRIVDILFAFPGLLFVFFLSATIKPTVLQWARDAGFVDLVRQGYVDYIVIFTALGLVGWGGMARIVRGQFLTLRNREFVLAARAIGLPQWLIAVKHVLPNALPPVIVVVSGGIGGTIAAEAALSFLGIGLQPPNPSWGGMMSDYMGYYRQPDFWLLLMLPALILMIVILAFTFVGEGLHEALNPYID